MRDDKNVPNDSSSTESNSLTTGSTQSSSQLSAQSSNEVYGDFNGDGFDDLAIGVPVEDLSTGAGTIINAGAVSVIYGSLSGLSATSPRPDHFWTQDISNVNDFAEAGVFFGSGLT